MTYAFYLRFIFYNAMWLYTMYKGLPYIAEICLPCSALLRLWRLISQYELILTTSYNTAIPAWIAVFVHRKNHSGFS